MAKKYQTICGRRYENRIYTYDAKDQTSVSFQQIKKIATDIAMERMNEQTSTICNIAVMTYIDIREDILEYYPLAKIPTAAEFAAKYKQYLEDYDEGSFTDADLKSYCRKNKIKNVWRKAEDDKGTPSEVSKN